MPHDNGSERRDFTRVSVRFEVSVATEGALVVSRRTRDVSMNGLFVICEQSVPKGADCLVTIHLDSPDESDRVDAKGRVTRITDDGFGIEFVEIPLEAYEHLRNLVLYNAEDAGKVEDELDHHLGLKPKPVSDD